MPGLDRTGPNGKGSRTGRGMGKCNSQSSSAANVPEQNTGRFSPGSGRGLRRGRGNGMNRGFGQQ
jgi:hypothetical protein